MLAKILARRCVISLQKIHLSLGIEESSCLDDCIIPSNSLFFQFTINVHTPCNVHRYPFIYLGI